MGVVLKDGLGRVTHELNTTTGILVSIEGCARCGKNHANMEFLEIESPVDDYSRLGLCPTLLMPVFMKTIQTGS